MAHVTLRKNENLEGLIKRFKKKVDDEGIIKEFKDRQYFTKPSVKRREKVKQAKRKQALKARQDKSKYESRR